VIEFKNIVKSFGPKSVLDGVSFDVKTGEVFFIIGASGVGKSVLIKHLVGLLYPDAGEISTGRTSPSSTKRACSPSA
jgi:phospholipid/cholesterol/gamma-HCH transport system ATP-binding protein